MTGPKRSNLSIMTIALMTVAAVVSLRGLPLMAKEGLAMFFYIGFCTLLFLLPASLVSAELGGAFGRSKGGVYTWVKAAFGARWGFVAIWLQWIQNVIWYPTVLAFAAASLTYLFVTPELASQGWYNALVILVIYWAATIFTLRGVSIQASATKWFMLVGTVLPGVLLMILALIWVIQGNPLEFLGAGAAKAAATATKFHPHFLPHISGLSSIAFLAGIILLFAGVEVQAVHATEMRSPQTDFPKSMLVSMAIIFFLFTLGALAIAVVIPAGEISLTAGLMQAFQQFLARLGLDWATPVVGLFVAFGAIGGVMAWIGGPSRGLLETAEDGEIPPILSKKNAAGMQVNILILQALIVTVLACLYLVMDNVSVAFFVLSAMTITLYLVMYILMYAAAIRLRYTRPDLPRAYRVPGGTVGLWLIAGVGLAAVAFALVVGFFPPDNLPVGNPALYVALVAGGMIVFIGAPLLINRMKKPGWVTAADADADAGAKPTAAE